jgi:hypothetical protein
MNPSEDAIPPSVPFRSGLQFEWRRGVGELLPGPYLCTGRIKVPQAENFKLFARSHGPRGLC